MKKIDALPKGPKWECETFTLIGYEKDEKGEFRQEEVEFWRRNPVECVRELIGNPSFNGKIRYVPKKVYRDETGNVREYDEMSTAEWWWEMQVSRDCDPAVR